MIDTSGRPGLGVNEINPVHGSIGAHRVRESFNPSHNSMVDKIKRYTADHSGQSAALVIDLFSKLAKRETL